VVGSPGSAGILPVAFNGLFLLSLLDGFGFWSQAGDTGRAPNTLGEPLRWLPASVLLRQHSDDLKTSESQRSATNARGQRSGSLSILGAVAYGHAKRLLYVTAF